MKIKLTFDQIRDVVNIHRWRNATYIELYKWFFQYVMDRQVELDKKESTKWMSNISSPILYMLTMAVYWMYQDSKVAFEVYKKIKIAKKEWLNAEEKAEYNKLVGEANNQSNNIIDLFEWIYEECDWSEEFDKSVLDAIILGNWFGWIWFERSEDTYEIMNSETWKKDIVTEKTNIPMIYRIVPLNIFTELSANSQKKAKINIIRKVLTTETINTIYSIYWVKYVQDKEETPVYLEKKDWNMVLRFMIFNNMPFVTTLKTLWWTVNGGAWETSSVWAMHTDIRSDNNYTIWDNLHEVYEVHTDKTIQIFVDGKDLWGLFPRLGPWKAKPIYVLGFRDWLNGLYDMWVGTIWYSLFKTIVWFLNLRVDNDRLAASSPMVVNADDNFFEGMDYLEQFPGKLIKVKDVEKQKPSPIQYNTAQAWAANSEVDMLIKNVQDAVGVSWYKMGVQQKVERSAKGVNELIESADASMKSFIGSIAKAKWFIAKYITLLALYYMDAETIKNYCWNENLQKEIDISDFVKDFSFNFNIQSVSSLRERQELEVIKWIIRDYSWATRPSWTPILNQEAWFRLVLEKSGASEDLLLDEDTAFEYMKKQVEDNAELKKIEASAMPQPQVDATWKPVEQAPWIVPAVWVNQQTVWAAPAPGVQGWSSWEWMAVPTNVLWNNWLVW